MTNYLIGKPQVLICIVAICCLILACKKSVNPREEDNTYNNLQALKIDYSNFNHLGTLLELDDGSLVISNFGRTAPENLKVIRLNKLGNPIDSLSFSDPELYLYGMAKTDKGTLLISGSRVEGEDPCIYFSQPCHYFTRNFEFFYQKRAIIIEVQVEPYLKLLKEVFVKEEDERYNSVDNLIKGKDGRIYFFGNHTNDFNNDHLLTWYGGNIYFGSIDQNLEEQPMLSTPLDVVQYPDYRNQIFEGRSDGRLYYPDGRDQVWVVDQSHPNELNVVSTFDITRIPVDHLRLNFPIVSSDNEVLIFRYNEGKNTEGKIESFVDHYNMSGELVKTETLYSNDSISFQISAFGENAQGLRIIGGRAISQDRTRFNLFSRQIGQQDTTTVFYGTPSKVEYPYLITPSQFGGFWMAGFLMDEDSDASIDVTGLFIVKTTP